MMTVALGLLAFRIAGDKAGAVLGTALAIKMIAYVGVAPVVGGFANFLPRRAFLVSMDMTRATVALALPFVTQVWQVYLLIFILQAASAAFTPTFQATIPDVLPDEAEYTRALSLSRLAYDMESLLSPVLAAARSLPSTGCSSEPSSASSARQLWCFRSRSRSLRAPNARAASMKTPPGAFAFISLPLA
jgi:MFS family permease